jgi:Coenzyme PQQ synthesis protein D (PqqD)
MSRIFRKNEGAVAERLVRGEAMLVPIRNDIGQMGRIFDLNPTATRIWDLAKQGRDEESIVAELAAEFEVPESELRADVADTLNDLVNVGALVPATTGETR